MRRTSRGPAHLDQVGRVILSTVIIKREIEHLFFVPLRNYRRDRMAQGIWYAVPSPPLNMFPGRREVLQESFAVREFRPEDYGAIVEIANLVDPDHPTIVEDERHDDEAWDAPRYVRRRYVASEPQSDTVVGNALFHHMPWGHHPQRFGLWIAVHPHWQRRGVGRAIYTRLMDVLRSLDVRALRTWVQETRSDSIAWLARRGFRELMRGWESRLNVAEFDVRAFADRWEPPPGVKIVTLAEELSEDPERLHLVWDLDNATSPDAPRVDPFTPASFEMYRGHVLGGPKSLPEAFFIAKAGDTYVGQSNLERSPALSDVLYTGYTGVRSEHRGRGIAFALKLRAIDYAKRHGYREIRTWNNTLNAPMLAIKVSLGFAKQPVWITLGKDFAG